MSGRIPRYDCCRLNYARPAQDPAEAVEVAGEGAGGPEDCLPGRELLLPGGFAVGEVKGRQPPDNQEMKGGVGQIPGRRQGFLQEVIETPAGLRPIAVEGAKVEVPPARSSSWSMR